MAVRPVYRWRLEGVQQFFTNRRAGTRYPVRAGRSDRVLAFSDDHVYVHAPNAVSRSPRSLFSTSTRVRPSRRYAKPSRDTAAIRGYPFTSVAPQRAIAGSARRTEAPSAAFRSGSFRPQTISCARSTRRATVPVPVPLGQAVARAPERDQGTLSALGRLRSLASPVGSERHVSQPVLGELLRPVAYSAAGTVIVIVPFDRKVLLC